MSVQDAVLGVRTRIAEATSHITRLLVDWQPTSTAAQLSAIQTKLNALDAQFAAAQIEFGTVPSLLQTYIGTDITPDVPNFTTN